jgi:hypothetical protein
MATGAAINATTPNKAISRARIVGIRG